MIPGNCLVCAFFIWIWTGGSIIKTYRPGTRIPHWVVLGRDNKVRHFTVVRDILPQGIHCFFFLGKFEVISSRR
jgi:hypothetical protein